MTPTTVYCGCDAATAMLHVGEARIPLLGLGTYGMSGPGLQNLLVAHELAPDWD